MNTAWAIFLGTGGAAGLLSFFWTAYRDWRSRHQAERKAEGEIKIDEVTEKRILAEAAQVNSQVAIEQQTWWKSQFDAVREELTIEQAMRRKLSIWAREHEVWDQVAWNLAKKSDPNYPPPPLLENID